MKEEKKEKKKKKIDPINLLSYLSILFLVPLLIEKNSRVKDDFREFHAYQGMVLFIFEFLTFFVGAIPFVGWMIMFFVNLLWLFLSVIGIINVINGEKKPLPLIGQLADHFEV